MYIGIQRLYKLLVKPFLVFRTSAPCPIPAKTYLAFRLISFPSISLPRA